MEPGIVGTVNVRGCLMMISQAIISLHGAGSRNAVQRLPLFKTELRPLQKTDRQSPIDRVAFQVQRFFSKRKQISEIQP
jgi:hypothetical protein